MKMKNIRELIQNYKPNYLKKEFKMKIAVPVNGNNQIDGHFGHCELYKVYSIAENGEINDAQTIPSPQGCGCKSNIASVLASQGVTVMLAGGIGEGAINVLKHSGIDVVRGCEGNADMVVKLFVAGKVTDSGSSCQLHEQHHGDGQDHVCNH
jgi:predicted Fe-Mo cluster-binding NifX family protein